MRPSYVPMMQRVLCEGLRLSKAYPESTARYLSEDAYALAVDEKRDKLVLDRIDSALGGHTFDDMCDTVHQSRSR